MKHGTQHTLLTELMLVMLFFSLSAAVILQLFTAARTQSDKAYLMTRAQTAAENMADSFIASRELTETEYEGFSLSFTYEDTAAEAGTLRRGTVIAADGDGNVLLELPCAKYIPDEEVRP